MTDKSTNKTYATIRHRVLKEMTDRPGSVVYRDDIAEAIGVEPAKVADTMRRLKADHPDIGDDFEIVVTAHAWRYVPNAKTTRALRAAQGKEDKKAGNGGGGRGKPMTHSLRDYFMNNPNRLIYLDELRTAMSLDDLPVEVHKVTVGINNAKIGSHEFRANLVTVVPGQAWQYNPVTVTNVTPAPTPTSEPVPTVTRSVPAPAVTAPEPAPVQPDSKLLLLEEVGAMADGSTLVRDDKQRLYKLIAL